MRSIKIRGKKGVMGQIISVFVLMLIISILAGMTFLFVGTLKTQVGESSEKTSVTVYNETLTTVTETGERVANEALLLFVLDTDTVVLTNASEGGEVIGAPNYTITSNGLIWTLATTDEDYNNTDWNITYDYTYIGGDDEKAYLATNKTEAAGFQTVSYLGILFLALIFGAILTVVLRVILPYINLGTQTQF